MNEKYLKRYKSMREFKKNALESVKLFARSKFLSEVGKPYLTKAENTKAAADLKINMVYLESTVDLFHAMLSNMSKQVQDKHWIHIDERVKAYVKEYHREHTKKNRRAQGKDPVPQQPVL